MTVLSSKLLNTIREQQNTEKTVQSSISFGSKNIYFNQDLKDLVGKRKVFQSPDLQQPQFNEETGITSVKSQPSMKLYSSQVSSSKRNKMNVTKSSGFASQTVTPPHLLSPKIQSTQAGYYRIPNYEQKSNDQNMNKLSSNSVSLVKGFPNEKLEIKKMIPKVQIQKRRIIRARQGVNSLHKAGPFAQQILPSVSYELQPLMKIIAERKKMGYCSRSKQRKGAKFSPIRSSPIKVDMPRVPFWMERGSRDELTVLGTQMIESRLDDYEPDYKN